MGKEEKDLTKEKTLKESDMDKRRKNSKKKLKIKDDGDVKTSNDSWNERGTKAANESVGILNFKKYEK